MDGRRKSIAGRMRLKCHAFCVSYETVYQFVYSADGRADELRKHVPERRAR